MRRTATAVLCGAFLALGVSACNPEPMDPTAECSGTEEKPAGEPGSAEVLLTVGNARGTRLLTTVLYADGWVLTLAEEAPGAVNALTAPRMAPPPPAGRPWQPAYLGSCQLDGIADLADEELAADADLGDVPITDQATTVVTYYGGVQPAVTSAYGLGQEEGADLSRAEQHGRAVLTGLLDALDEATPVGDVLPVETVQVTGDAGGQEPVGWPGPPLAELFVEDSCGELTGEQARSVLDYLTSTDEEVGRLRAEVVPPGLPACS